ncbi:MAG: hypothetical protein K8L91_12000 [Anaerolineae bacterium]|nr:hypothetical protein [Anaerolineae bacterium]
MGVNPLLWGLSTDLYSRCQRLIHLSAINLPYQELSLFSQQVSEKLYDSQQRISDLKAGDEIRDNRFWRDAYYEYQDISREVALIEQFAIPILIRYSETDHITTRLVAKLGEEIGYPQELLPVMTTSSNQYYWAKPELKVIAMPTGDVGGVLGWPDLIHEMAHILLESWADFLQPFRSNLKQYYHKKRQSIGDLDSSESANKWLGQMKLTWGNHEAGVWQIEMAANLIATFVIGPSFGWQHIRLSINHSNNPFKPSPGDPLEDHPADQAQLESISEMLILMDLKNESDLLLQQWEEIIGVSRVDRPQGYDLYYPSELLKGIAQTVFDGCKAKGLIPFTHNKRHPQTAIIVNLIDQGWRQFRESSKDYPDWEELADRNLKQYLNDTL